MKLKKPFSQISPTEWLSAFLMFYCTSLVIISLLRAINFVMASGESGAWLSIARS